MTSPDASAPLSGNTASPVVSRASTAPPHVLPCIVCGKRLSSVTGDTAQPADAVMCVAIGNYGSTVLDNLFGKLHDFNVCDDCFKEAKLLGRLGPERENLPCD